jgi:hypothetical protein
MYGYNNVIEVPNVRGAESTRQYNNNNNIVSKKKIIFIRRKKPPPFGVERKTYKENLYIMRAGLTIIVCVSAR